MTLTLPQARPLSGEQQRAVERARELAEAAATVQTLAAYLEVSRQHPGQFFYASYGAAMDRLRDLLASLDEAGAGQADPGGDPRPLAAAAHRARGLISRPPTTGEREALETGLDAMDIPRAAYG